MAYYEDPKNVDKYMTMAEGYDGRKLIQQLRQHLPEGSTVLELGMGPGKDMDMLKENYDVTGSDTSKVFLDRYREKHPAADLIELDAVALQTQRNFGAIYSNKVLHQLTKEELTQSFRRQAALLNAGGVVLHSFWYGEGVEVMEGIHSVYYTEESVKNAVGPEFEVLSMKRYAEMEDEDSLCIILKKT